MRGDGLTMGGAKVKLKISFLPPIRADSCAGGPPEQNQTLNMERHERKSVLAVARVPLHLLYLVRPCLFCNRVATGIFVIGFGSNLDMLLLEGSFFGTYRCQVRSNFFKMAESKMAAKKG